MNLADKLRLLAVAEAVADELRTGLKAEAERVFREDGLTVSWKAPGVTAYSGSSQDAVYVADEDELMCWLLENRPDWVKTVVVPVNPGQITRWIKGLAKEPDLGKVPGIALRKGGQFRSLSIKIDGGVKEALAEVARDALDGGGIPDELAALFASRQQELEAPGE